MSESAMNSDRALHIALIQILLGIRYKLKSIDKDLDDLMKIIARHYNLEIREPGHEVYK